MYLYMMHSMNCVPTQPVLENYTPPAPITAPIMAPLGADPQAQPVSSGAPQAMVQGQHGAQVPYSGMHQQQFAPPAVNQVMPNTSVEGAPGAPTGDVIQVERTQISHRCLVAFKILKSQQPQHNDFTPNNQVKCSSLTPHTFAVWFSLYSQSQLRK